MRSQATAISAVMLSLSLAACSSEASSAPEADTAIARPSTAPVIAQALEPSSSDQSTHKALESGVPAFDYVGQWVDDPACPATDYYLLLNDDGSAVFFNQHGRWEEHPAGLQMNMEAAEATETSDAQSGWSQLVPVRVVSPNEFAMMSTDGRETRFYRCG